MEDEDKEYMKTTEEQHQEEVSKLKEEIEFLRQKVERRLLNQ